MGLSASIRRAKAGAKQVARTYCGSADAIHSPSFGGLRLRPRQLRYRRLEQDEISARLARVEPDNRATLCGECKTFWLATQIAELPRIKESGGTATRGKIIEPRNRGGFVTEHIARPKPRDRECGGALAAGKRWPIKRGCLSGYLSG
jgi:hypothetical protein